jgi:hypothetical protein
LCECSITIERVPMRLTLAVPAGILALVVALDATGAIQARAGDPSLSDAAEAEAVCRDPHTLGNPHQIRVRRLELDLSVDFVRKRLRGTACLDFQRMSGCAGDTPLILDTRDLAVERVEAAPPAGGWAVARFALGPDDPVLGTPLTITVPGDAARVRITYHTGPGARALQWLAPAQTAGG